MLNNAWFVDLQLVKGLDDYDQLIWKHCWTILYIFFNYNCGPN